MAVAQEQVSIEHVQQQLASAKAYTLVFLTQGKVKDDAKAAQNQMPHLQYLFSLKEGGHVSIFGPLTDNSNIRGILIFNVTDIGQVKKLMDGDPHVKAGHLSYEIHPWFGVPGQTLGH